MVPLPHAMLSAGQYLSQPQQMRSGFFGLRGIFATPASSLALDRARMTYVTPAETTTAAD